MKQLLLLRPLVLRVETITHLTSGIAYRRYVHQTTRQQSSASHAETLHPAISHDSTSLRTDARPSESPLSILPTSTVFRTYLITSLSSSPSLFRASVSFLQRIAASKGPLLSTERDPLVRWALKKTFYAQFCAGENRPEVQRTVDQLRSMGFTGLVLEYALEVLESGNTNPVAIEREIEAWRKGMLETVSMASPDDFVALK